MTALQDKALACRAKGGDCSNVLTVSRAWCGLTLSCRLHGFRLVQEKFEY